MSDAWRQSALVVAAILAFRAMPILVFVSITKQVRRRAKVAIVAATAGIVAALRLGHLLPWGPMALGYAYMVAWSCAAPWGARSLKAGRLTRGALFSVCALVFLVVPGLLWPPEMKTPVLLVGWDLTLSVYSYCAEVASRAAAPALGDCLFFLLVNPALVYTRRGVRTGAPALHLGGLARAALGVVTLFAASVFLGPAYDAVAAPGGLERLGVHGALAALVVPGAVRFLVGYGWHSGLASLQIGVLRQLGWIVPERYDWPVLSVSTADFWRRWNTYVGQWALRYVFRPLSLGSASRFRGRAAWRRLDVGAAVVATFAAVGLLHDAYAYLSRFVVQTQMTEIFLVCGVLTVLSVAGDRLRKRAESSRLVRVSPWSRASVSFAFRLALWATMAGGIVRLWVS